MGCGNSQPEPRTERQRLVNPNSPQKPNPNQKRDINQQNKGGQQPQPQGNARGQPRKDIPKPGGSTVIPVSSPKYNFQPQKEEIILGSSYTEQHAMNKQSDFSNELFYKKLIEKTSNDLIDVSQTILDVHESNHIDGAYLKQLKKAEKNINFESVKFLSLPEAALSPDGPLPLLSDTPHAVENEMIQKLGHEVLMSLKRMTVKDRGDLVVPFSSFKIHKLQRRI